MMDTPYRYNLRRKRRLVDRMRNEKSLQEKVRLAVLIYKDFFGGKDRNIDGGPGSGNWGHEGRKGKVGGSKEGGGVHNRQTTKTGEYTSFTKQKKQAAKSHQVDSNELSTVPLGSVLHLSNGNSFVKVEDAIFFNYKTGALIELSGYDTKEYLKEFASDAKIAIPDSANPNYSVTRVTSEEEYEKRASKAFNAQTKPEYDAVYREQSGEVYSSLDYYSKKALESYTGSGYIKINSALRDVNTQNLLTNDQIDSITSAIDKSELKEDTILNRECNISTLETLLELKKGSITKETAQNAVGKSGTDDGFMSTGSSRDSKFLGKSVKLEILAPAGTKALYVEPFSTLGKGAGFAWDSAKAFDGKSSQDSFSNEMETILQRSTSLLVISGGYNSKTYRYEYKVVVTGQDYTNSKYNKKINS